ncbi:MAG: DUF2220 domain-containing protein [Coriobacteriia bacterium]|nr:DUF2220 domain-containing protein [Coriobacteriia bacterium]
MEKSNSCLEVVDDSALTIHCLVKQFWHYTDFSHSLTTAFPDSASSLNNWMLRYLFKVLDNVSIMMDEHTLLDNRSMWVCEAKPFKGSLAHLNAAEQAVYQKLCTGDYALNLRLEQERIPYQAVKEAIVKATAFL